MNANRTYRLTRELVNKLPERVDERGPIMISDPEPEFFERTAAQVLSRLHKSDELWIFAVGSLIWNPRMEVADRKVGRVEGWRRSFCLGPDRRFRGNPAAPGIMLSLDRGDECWGVAMRMKPDDMHQSLVELMKLEPPVPPEWVEVRTDAGVLPAIAFVANRSFPLYQPEPPEEQLIDILSSAVGHIGSMADYVLNTVTELEKAGIHDTHLWRVQELIAERLDGLD